MDAKMAVEPFFQLGSRKRLGFIIPMCARDLQIFKQSAGLTGSEQSSRLTNWYSGIISLGRWSAPDADLQSGQLAHRSHGIGQSEMQFTTRRNFAFQGRPMADHRTRVKMCDNFILMTPDDVFRWGPQFIRIYPRGKLSKFPGFDCAGDFRSSHCIGKDDSHIFPLN